MKKILSEANLGRCDFLKHILETHGIPCLIKNEQGSLGVGMGYPLPSGPSLPFSWLELWIENDEDFDQAVRILEETDPPAEGKNQDPADV